MQDLNEEDIINKAKDAGQEHVFKFWNELSEESKKNLLSELKTIDFNHLQKLVDEHIIGNQKEDDTKLEPIDVIKLPSNPQEKEKEEKAKEVGINAIKEGKVGLFLVAGGQGSRLGYDGPKGCFKISPVKKKSIFQLHAEKILALQRKFDVKLPFYIMTSKQNHSATLDFFEKHNYFGLDKEDVRFFRQAMIPAVNKEGRLILADKDKIFMNPDGHGGSISAMKRSGALDDAKKRGIEYLFYFQVDNVLINIADPIFIGYHILENAQMSSKVVRKVSADEKVGVVGKINGKTGVIEYSCLPKELATKTDSEGNLLFWAGSIAIHVIDIDFIEAMSVDEFSLPYYKAHKAVSYIDDNGKIIEPDKPNAIKFEKFIFDALKKTSKSVTMQVLREKEFAPVKNKEGQDSVDTAKELLINYDKGLLKDVGISFNDNAILEISPLLFYDIKDKISNIDIPDFSELYIGENK